MQLTVQLIECSCSSRAHFIDSEGYTYNHVKQASNVYKALCQSCLALALQMSVFERFTGNDDIIIDVQRYNTPIPSLLVAEELPVFWRCTIQRRKRLGVLTYRQLFYRSA